VETFSISRSCVADARTPGTPAGKVALVEGSENPFLFSESVLEFDLDGMRPKEIEPLARLRESDVRRSTIALEAATGAKCRLTS
jgi:hypothetical protein